ncbi:hypothetical protein TNCV_1445871 [Trichonephila clavipes]|nr:hypothetical protein TNCV_1445871 [Trichonephila clavipes]
MQVTRKAPGSDTGLVGRYIARVTVLLLWLNWAEKLVLKLDGVESEGTMKSGMRKEQLEKFWLRLRVCIALGVDMAELLVVGTRDGILLGGWLEGGRYKLMQGVWSVSSASSIVGRVVRNLILLRSLRCFLR